MAQEAKPKFMKDYDVIDAFIGYLREHGHPELRIDRYPDKENRTSSDIDAIAGPFAIEHTSIDTLPNQRRNNEWFMKVAEGLEEEFSSQLSSRLAISFYDGSITKGQDWSKLRQGFKNWISEEKHNPRLADGPHWVDNVPGIPFQFHVIKEQDSSPGVRFKRFSPENDYLPYRIRKLLDRKAEKLKKYQNLGKTTVLLIENDDIALMDIHGRKILNAIQEVYRFSLPIGVDEIWYADTAELPIRFKDFTSDLLVQNALQRL